MSSVPHAQDNGKRTPPKDNSEVGFTLLNGIRKLRGLRKTERLLLLELGFRKNNTTGQCDPGYARLAEDLELSVSDVRRAIRTLEKKGLIRKTPGFAKVSSKYAFTLPAEAFKEETGSVTSEPHPPSPEGGGVVTRDHREWSPATTGSVHPRPQGVVTGEHLTALELRKELRREEREQHALSKPSFHDSKRQKARPENPAAIHAFMESEGMAPMQALKESETMFHYYESKGWKNIVDWQSSAKVWMLRARPAPGSLEQTTQAMNEQWDRIEQQLSVGDTEAAETRSFDVTSPTEGSRPRTRQKPVGKVLTDEELFDRDLLRYKERKPRRTA